MQRLKRVLRLERAAGALSSPWRRGAMKARLQRLRWWPGLVILVVAGVAAGVLLVRTNSGEEGDLPEVFTAQRGSLVAVIAPTGEVYARRQADLSFDANKVDLIALNVVPGQQVKAGDLLARIDPIALERAVTQAEADLTVAKDDLDRAENPYTELDLRQARLAVAQAEAALEEAKQNLHEARAPYTELDLTQARLSVAQAEAALEDAKDSLATEKNRNTELDLAEARLAVRQAEADLSDAREDLDDLLSPDIEAARAAVRDASASLESAQSQLIVAQNDPDNAERIRTLEYEAVWYRNNYWEAQAKFDAGKIDQQKLDWEYSNMLAAEEKLTAAKAKASSSLTSAQNQIAQAQEAYQEALEELAGLQDGPDALELARAEDQVTQAEYELAKAQESLAEVESGSGSTELTKAENQVTQAEYELAKAQADLAEMEAGPNASDVIRSENDVAQSEYELSKAQEALAEIQAGPDPKEIEVARARLISAQATLDEAQAALEDAAMTAPFDGTIISVAAEVGDLVVSDRTVVTVADLSDLRVRAFVDETDISRVEIDQEVEMTFDAFPGRRMRGQVLEVPLQGELTQNILTYEVPVTLEGAEGVSLKPGMTANVSIVVGRRQNVLLVPAMAVQQGEEGDVVTVQDTPQGPGVSALVEVGLTDGTYVEIVRGLNEGDRVLVEYQAPQEQFGGMGGFRMMAVGGRGGMPR
jgi:HlyD family secretion protein